MHRYRLRYIVYGLLIYIQSAFCRTCGSDFDDVPSRTALAGVVFEGNLLIKHEDYSSFGYYNATFRVRSVLKGDLPREEARNKYKVILVGTFGPENDPDKCISTLNVGTRYLIFLQGTSSSSLDPKVPYYKVAAFPATADKNSKREVRRYSCSRCAKAPKAKVIPRPEVNKREGDKVELRCKPSGRPQPNVTWYKDRLPIDETDRNFKIKRSKKQSRLRIKKARLGDEGTYMCQASNVVGDDYMETRVRISKIEADDDRRITCPEQNYCLNGGTCFEFPQLKTKFCQCKNGYDGYRCRDSKIDVASRGPTVGATLSRSREAHKLDRALTISGIAIAAVVVAALVIAAYFMAKKKRDKFRKRQEDKKRMQAEFSNGTYQPLDNGPTLTPAMDIRTVSALHTAGTQTDDTLYTKPSDPWLVSSREKLPDPLPNGRDKRREHHADQLQRQHTAPSMLSSPEAPRQRLSATSETPDMDYGRRKRGSRGNVEIVNAIVEFDPSEETNHHHHHQGSKSSSPSQNSKTESALAAMNANGLQDQPPPVPYRTPKLEAGDSLESDPASAQDPDQQSDYDNQQASDLEVNLESEADVGGLDASGDEVEGQGQSLIISGSSYGEHPELGHSDTSDADSESSSAGEEQALFARLQSRPRVSSISNTSQRSRTSLPPQPPQPPQLPTAAPHHSSSSGQSWDDILPDVDRHIAFNNPYALDSDLIPNQYFHNPAGHVAGDASHLFSADDVEYPYDPDPDATVV